MVAKFRGSFGDTTYLSPQGFHDFNGDCQTGSMHKTPRFSNVSFIEVKYDMPLSVLGSPFHKSEVQHVVFLALTSVGAGRNQSGYVNSSFWLF